jgi:heme A synthase
MQCQFGDQRPLLLWISLFGRLLSQFVGLLLLLPSLDQWWTEQGFVETPTNILDCAQLLLLL